MVGINQLHGGNLSRIAGLDFLNKFYYAENNKLKHAICAGRGNVALYLVGDSYTKSIYDTNFACISDFYPINRYDGGYYHLDTTKKNILIIESTENCVREYFGSLRVLQEVRDSTINHKKEFANLLSSEVCNTGYASFLSARSINDLFNKNINQNLQCNLFNYNVAKWIFEYKAALNYYLFDRASGNVVISKDKKYLLLKNTVSFIDTGSSYFPLQQAEVAHLVDNLNIIYQHYKDEGFKEVYLSIIPNTASVVQPEGYNNLIPLIQTDPRLKIKVIDSYFMLGATPDSFFYRGDTHWNLHGKQKWVDKVNKLIVNDIRN